MAPSRHRLRDRLAVAAVILLAVVTVGVFYGPTWYQQVLHPLSYQQVIAKYASEAKVDPYLVAAVVNIESGFRADVVSPAGAVGLMQVKPSTAQAIAQAEGIKGKMTVEALSDPQTNVRIGTIYLAELIARYDGNVGLALSAYNGGMTNADIWAAEWARDHGKLSDTIDFPETAHYVDEVASQAAEYRRLYPTAFVATVK